MGQADKIVLCGNSLMIAGAAASLCGAPDLQVIRIDSIIRKAAEQLALLGAAVFVFDIAEADSGFVMRFLTEYPSIRLVGLDAARNVVIVFSSERFVELTVGDLAQIIRHSPAD
jgi:hypothetical protein